MQASSLCDDTNRRMRIRRLFGGRTEMGDRGSGFPPDDGDAEIEE